MYEKTEIQKLSDSSKEFFVTLADALAGGAAGWPPLFGLLEKTYQVFGGFPKIRLERNVRALVEQADGLAMPKLGVILARITETAADPVDIADTICQILLESEKELKPKLLRGLIYALGHKKITAEEFHDLALITYSSSVPQLNALEQFFEESGGKWNYVSQRPHLNQNEILLVSVGFAFGGQLAAFVVSDLGKKLYEFGFLGSIRDI